MRSSVRGDVPVASVTHTRRRATSVRRRSESLEIGRRHRARGQGDVCRTGAHAEAGPIVFPAHLLEDYRAYALSVKRRPQLVEHAAREVGRHHLMASLAERHRQRARAAAHVEHRLARLDSGQLEGTVRHRGSARLSWRTWRRACPIVGVVEPAPRLLEPLPLVVPVAGGQLKLGGFGHVVFGAWEGLSLRWLPASATIVAKGGALVRADRRIYPETRSIHPMHVELLYHTPDPERAIATAGAPVLRARRRGRAHGDDARGAREKRAVHHYGQRPLLHARARQLHVRRRRRVSRAHATSSCATASPASTSRASAT